MEAGPTFGRKSTNLRTIATTHAGRVVQQMELSSFINPMNLSLDFTLTKQEDACDPDYDPLVDISASLSTSDLENFHQLILMYCAKRYAYTPPFYRIRNLLAALDHNHHADRPMKLDKHGEQRYHRCYNKKSKRWTVRPVKEDKDYSYITEMAEKLFMLCITDKHGIYKQAVLEEKDPRWISNTLSEEKPPPSKQSVKLKKKSRFLKK